MTQYLYPDEDKLLQKLIPKVKESLVNDLAFAVPRPLPSDSTRKPIPQSTDYPKVPIRNSLYSPKTLKTPESREPAVKLEKPKPDEKQKPLKKPNINRKKSNANIEIKPSLEKIESFQMRNFKLVLNLKKVPKTYKQMEGGRETNPEPTLEEPKEDVFMEEVVPILKKFDATRTKLEMIACSGSKTIIYKTFDGKTKIRKVLRNAEKGGRKEIEVDLIGYRPVFNFGALGNKGLMSLEGEPPFMMIKLTYIDKQDNLFPLGTTKVEFWRKVAEKDVYCWYPPFGEVNKEIVPTKFESQNKECQLENKNAGNLYILDEKSEIYFYIYTKVSPLSKLKKK